jgi:predicted DNA-binding ribbon-helix-helix protein
MLINRNINVGPLRTSIRLEPEFWDALADIAQRERKSIDDICFAVDKNTDGMTRTAAIRVYIATYFQNLARARAGTAPRPPIAAVAAK